MRFGRMETKRLHLRPLRLADAPAVKGLAGHPLVAATTLSIPHPYPEGAAEAFIQFTHHQVMEGKGYTFAMVRREDGDIVGVIGLGGVDPLHRRAELGYWVGVPYWGQGYATEATLAFIDFGFQNLGLNSIFARHFTRNPASGRVMQKAGMQYEGRLRQAVCKDAQFEDLACYSILREEWGGSPA